MASQSSSGFANCLTTTGSGADEEEEDEVGEEVAGEVIVEEPGNAVEDRVELSLL